MECFSIFVALAAGFLSFAASAQAGVFNPLITIDEMGNGTIAFSTVPVSPNTVTGAPCPTQLTIKNAAPGP